eukprot:GFKZ01015695.1.p1 GENE.GFKZ01015695.1~~GFKZ01015695.1.p1  ORF type:complete len:477 (-),score=46.46 GFKZ01015695.1:1146-2576(-)
MHTALLLAVGTRGDHEPVIALAAALLRSETFHTVHLYMSPDYKHLPAAHPNLHIHHHPLLSTQSFYTTASHALTSARPDDPIAANRIGLLAILQHCITPLIPILHALCETLRPSILLATTLGLLPLKSLSLAHHTPAYLLHMQPNLPNPRIPFYLSSLSHARGAAAEIAAHPTAPVTAPRNVDHSHTYDDFFALFEAQLPLCDPIHTRLALPPLPAHCVRDIPHGRDPEITNLFSYPSQLIPFPLPPNRPFHLVETLAEAYLPPNWSPATSCPKLTNYLGDTKSKPFCLTVGARDPDLSSLSGMSTALLSGLRRAAIPRVLLLRGSDTAVNISASHLSDPSLRAWAAEHVFESTESPQFAWLFPLCSAVLCHGGAGTVAAALRAGVPVVVAPANVDQFFWAEIVDRWGVGAAVSQGVKECAEGDVEEAVRKGVSEEVLSAVRRYAERQRGKKGGCDGVVELMSVAVGERSGKSALL